MLNHSHLLVIARSIHNPPSTTEAAISWLGRLTELVNMKIFFGPEAKYCTAIDNEGVTGLVCIETSHASLHCWDSVDNPYIQCDLYSCMPFDVDVVLNHVAAFDPEETEYMVVDRNSGLKVIDHKVITQKI